MLKYNISIIIIITLGRKCLLDFDFIPLFIPGVSKKDRIFRKRKFYKIHILDSNNYMSGSGCADHDFIKA